MLEHAHRDDVVRLVIVIPIVLELEFDREVSVAPATIVGLFARDGDADARYAVALPGKAHKGPPATANIVHSLAWLETDLAADEIELVVLSLIEVVGVSPVGAASGEAAIESCLEKVDPEIVVNLGGAPNASTVRQPAERRRR